MKGYKRNRKVKLGSSDYINYYKDLEERYHLKLNSNYSNLVVPNDNFFEAFHGWFPIKEGFSSRILHQVLNDSGLLDKPELTLLDPFVGSGTTIVSALSLKRRGKHINAYGIECNPFLKFVAETKIKAMGSNKDDFQKFIQSVVKHTKHQTGKFHRVPKLSTFNNSKYFDREKLNQLAGLKLAIETIEGTKLQKDIAMLCLARIIESASYLRKDGRALRYMPNKNQIDVIEEFLKRVEMFGADIEKVGEKSNFGVVFMGDGRCPQGVLPNDIKFDLIFFSPPYPNNIDYTEVYKLENWFLDLINDDNSFRHQRLKSMRSHNSLRFPDLYYAEQDGYREIFDDIVNPILDAVPKNREELPRKRLIKGYFDDMLKTLTNNKNMLSKGGYLVYVVGNSLHGTGGEYLLIAADLIITRLAEIAGLKVESFNVARYLKRRKIYSQFLRESVVFLRKK